CRPRRTCLDGGRRGDRDRPPRLQARSRPHDGDRTRGWWCDFGPGLPGDRRAVARLLVVLRRAVGHRTRWRRAMRADHVAVYELLAEYGALIDAAKFDEWLDLFAEECRYQIVPRENYDRGLPAALMFCDSRAVLEDRIRALREANKYNIHTDRHLIGLPHVTGSEGEVTLVEAAFAVYQTDQEGETRLFATGLYRDRIVSEAGGPKSRDKLVLLDTLAVPSLLATPL